MASILNLFHSNKKNKYIIKMRQHNCGANIKDISFSNISVCKLHLTDLWEVNKNL